MLRTFAGEAASLLIARNIPDLPNTELDLWATEGAFVLLGFCALVMVYAMLRGK